MTLILILAWCVYGSLLVAAIYFTQATTRRVLGALAGGCAVALIGAGVEGLAHARGWWRYTSGDTPVGPLAMYPLLVVAFAFLALIGWRVMRRFGSRPDGVPGHPGGHRDPARLFHCRESHGSGGLRAGHRPRDHRRSPLGGIDGPGDHCDARGQRSLTG